jgi:hypothetical protein
MKVALGYKIQNGPYGGANQFGVALRDFLQKKGCTVVFDLKDADADIVLMLDPRARLKRETFGAIEIIKYVCCTNPNAIIIHRINECDERKGTKTVNKQLSLANSIADYAVFISSWLEQLHRGQNRFTENSSVIKNGADRSIFTYQKKQLPTDRKIRLVTHHWSSNWNKGWDVYTYLDEQLATTSLGDHFELHYFGNVPKNLSLKRIHVHPPKTGKELAESLHNNDIYLTASLNEPAGMHHIEGALCGLPLLYRNSGALPEYCNDYGVMFNDTNDVLASLEKLILSYDLHTERLAHYGNSGEHMCEEYLNLFSVLLSKKQSLIATRRHNTFERLNRLITSIKFKWFLLKELLLSRL